MKRTKRPLRRQRTRYPMVLPSYLLSPNGGNVAFVQRAPDERAR